MARRESYNPLLKSYPDSEKVNALSIGAETLYTRLIAATDDAGRYYGDAKWVLARLFTARMLAGQVTESDVEKWLRELESVSLAIRYRAANVSYLELVGAFKKLRHDVKPQVVFPPRDTESVTDTERIRTESVTQRSENVPLDPTQPNPVTEPTHVRSRAANFVRPTEDDVREFCEANGLTLDIASWFDHYESNGWKVGRVPMKSWQAAVRKWARNGYGTQKTLGIPQL